MTKRPSSGITKRSRNGSNRRNDYSEIVLDNNFLTNAELVDIYDYLKRYAFLTFNIIDSDEYVQSAVVRGLSKTNLYDKSKSNKKTWFSYILKNMILLDRNVKKTPINLSSNFRDECSINSTYLDIIQDENEYIDLDKHLEYILSIIRNRYEYLYYFIKGYNYKEISKKLNIPLCSLKTRIRGERMQLIAYLRDNGDEELNNVINIEKLIRKYGME